MPTIQVNYFDCMFSRFNVFHLHFPSWSCFSLLYSYGRIARNRQKWLVVTKHIWSLMKFVKWLKMRVPCELWYQLSFWSSIFYFKKTLHREKKIGPYFCWFQLCINNLTCGKKKDKFWGIYNNKNKKNNFFDELVTLPTPGIAVLLYFVMNCSEGRFVSKPLQLIL
jgi:hypothetical protein